MKTSINLNTFFYKNTYTIIAVIGIVIALLFAYIIYNLFTSTVRAHPEQFADNAVEKTTAIQEPLFDSVQQFHTEKQAQAGVYQGFIVDNPFNHEVQ